MKKVQKRIVFIFTLFISMISFFPICTCFSAETSETMFYNDFSTSRRIVLEYNIQGLSRVHRLPLTLKPGEVVNVTYPPGRYWNKWVTLKNEGASNRRKKIQNNELWLFSQIDEKRSGKAVVLGNNSPRLRSMSREVQLGN